MCSNGGVVLITRLRLSLGDLQNDCFPFGFLLNKTKMVPSKRHPQLWVPSGALQIRSWAIALPSSPAIRRGPREGVGSGLLGGWELLPCYSAQWFFAAFAPNVERYVFIASAGCVTVFDVFDFSAAQHSNGMGQTTLQLDSSLDASCRVLYGSWWKQRYPTPHVSFFQWDNCLHSLHGASPFSVMSSPAGDQTLQLPRLACRQDP